MLAVSAQFHDVDSGLSAEFVESHFVLTIDGRQFRGGPETRTTIEIEIGGFIRSRLARHWGSFYGIESDDEEIVRRVVFQPGQYFRTAEALSAYSMVPRLMEPADPLIIVGIAGGKSETLLIRSGTSPIERVEVDAEALTHALRSACRES